MSTEKTTVKLEEQVIARDRKKNIEIITLNRPRARNSLSVEMITEISKTLEEISKDPEILVVVLAANGPAFCAGHDLKEITAHRADQDCGKEFFQQTMSDCSQMMRAIVKLPQPVIAAVQGVATAAGCQLVASCDLAVASSEARFATPGVDIGLFCSTPMVALSRNVAPKHAMELLLTGELISAEHAQTIGLINRIVKPGDERDSALELAKRIAQKSPHAVRLGKKAFYRQSEMTLEEATAEIERLEQENISLNEQIESTFETNSPRRS